MKNKVLFVCGHNSGRSQMAEVYFNTYNTNKDLEAISAGTGIKGDRKINPKVVELLRSKGIDIHTESKKYIPKELTEVMVNSAIKIYTMGCMDNICGIGDIKINVDYDFGLDDPARKDTDIEKMWEDFEGKIKKEMKGLCI